MAYQYSTDTVNTKLDAVETAIGASAILRLLSGSMPANCAAAQTGTLLASISLPSNWMNNAASRSKAKAGSWTTSGITNGTVGYFRILESTGTTCHIQGTAGTSGTDMILSSASIATGQAVSVVTFTLVGGNPST